MLPVHQQWVITDVIQMAQVINTYRRHTVVAAAFDTETTGLHIISDKPFLYVAGWIADSGIYVWGIDLEHMPLYDVCIKEWHRLVRYAPIYLGHNVKYDLHMMTNIGIPYNGDNINDTQIFIRMAMDNIPTRFGGPSLKLKVFATKYVDPNANKDEHEIQKMRSTIASDYNKKLQQAFNMVARTIGDKTWTLKRMAILNDKLFKLTDLPKVYEDAYKLWFAQLPASIKRHMYIRGLVDSEYIPYDMLDRAKVMKYALNDIVITLGTWWVTAPVVEARMNTVGVKLEQEIIYDLFNMERVGFKLNKEYLYKAEAKMYHYILELRQEFANIAKCNIKVSQHPSIKETFKRLWDLSLPSTGAEVLSQLASSDIPTQAKRFIELIEELRTLEKWYSTYLIKLINDLEYYGGDRAYTQINQVGAASGRVSSDFQQFPKGGITTKDGEELFNPRRMILAEGKGNIYLDYSQIELRFQAFYTILVGHPDLNLCRAYMPYKCYRKLPVGRGHYKESYDYTNIDHTNAWNSGEWYYEEDPDKLWTPTDVHGATTKAAFDIDETHPDFHDLRYVGKRVNFAKNYGAEEEKVGTMFPEFDAERIKKIDQAYYKAFPGIKEYHTYCRNVSIQGNVLNLFGVRYYGVNAHKLKNMLIQGSSAYYLKMKIHELELHKKRMGYKSVMQMNIHDELSFIWHEDDPPTVFLEYKAIMEDWPDTQVPIVADMEYTNTNWYEKEEVDVNTWC